MPPARLNLVFCSLLVGCIQPPSWHAADADAEVDRILLAARAKVDGEQARTVEPLPRTPVPLFQGKKPRVVTLDECLALAITYNRDYLRAKEGLYQSGLSTALTRFNFGPQLAASLNYRWDDSEFGQAAHSAGANASISQILPTGGVVSLSGGWSTTWLDTRGDDSHSTGVTLSLSQPLLRGVGYLVSHESLTQADRSLIYAVRAFELFRQDFSIGIASSYYSLVSQQQTLSNQDRTYREARSDRKKAEALRKVDRNTDEQVFRARRREVQTEARLIDARASYRRSVDDFKILLGLPVSANIQIVPANPPYLPVSLDPASAVKAAHANRLDLMTQKMQVEDSERGVLIASNGLLPDVTLDLSGGFSAADAKFKPALADEWSVSGGVTVNLPLQLKSERNTYRNSMIRRDQAQRAHELLVDRIKVSVRDQLRQLESIERQVTLQIQQIRQERRAVTVTRIRYEAGLLDNRDLLEARQGLIDAQNALINLKADHFIRRLRLMRSMGVLRIDKKGKWS